MASSSPKRHEMLFLSIGAREECDMEKYNNTMKKATFTLPGTDKQESLSITAYNQFDFDGVWLKGNLHCHIGGPQRVASSLDWYRLHDFDFLTFTDHGVITPLPKRENDEFISIPGAELYSGHIVGLGISEISPKGPVSGKGIAGAVKSQGGLTILANPY